MRKILLLMGVLLFSFYSRAQEWSTVPAPGIWTSAPVTGDASCASVQKNGNISWTIDDVSAKTVYGRLRKNVGTFATSGTWEIRADNECGTVVKSGGVTSGVSWVNINFTPADDRWYWLVFISSNGTQYSANYIDFNYTECSSAAKLSAPGSLSYSASNNTLSYTNYDGTAKLARVQIVKTNSGFSTYQGWYCSSTNPDATNSNLIINSQIDITGTGTKSYSINLSPGTYYFSVRVGTTASKSQYAQPYMFTVPTPFNLVSGSPCANISPSPLAKDQIPTTFQGTISNTGGTAFTGNLYLSWHDQYGTYISDLATWNGTLNPNSSVTLSRPATAINSPVGSYKVVLKYQKSGTSGFTHICEQNVTVADFNLSGGNPCVNINPNPLVRGEIPGNLYGVVYNTGGASFIGNVYLSWHSSTNTFINDLASFNGTIAAGQSTTLTRPNDVITSPVGSYKAVLKYQKSGTTGYTHICEYPIAVVDRIATPVISPASGTYNISRTISITCATPSVTIRYTTDGTEPTASSTIYTGAFTITANATVKAKAFRSGWADSFTATNSYTINQKPSVVTGTATNVLENTSTLNATINPNGFAVSSYYFEYGTTNALGQSTASSNLAAGSAVIPVTANIISLTHYTDYYYRIVATSSIGTSYGEIKVFKTAKMPCWWPDDCTDKNCGALGMEAYNAFRYLCGIGAIQDDLGVQPDELARKEDLAKMTAVSLFGNLNYTCPADSFKMRYQDLDNTNPYCRHAKILQCLTFGDGFGAFELDRLVFNPGSTVERVYALKLFMEAWNIPINPTNPTNNPFPNDPDVVSLIGSRFYPYIQVAAELGIISTSNTLFDPYRKITRAEAAIIIHRILKSTKITRPSAGDLQNVANYYNPTDYNEANFALAKSEAQGNFKHYASADFNINGNMPLVFSHEFISDLVSLPEDYNAVMPFSPGWTHNYNIYLIQVTNILGTHIPKDYKRVYIIWPNGTSDVFIDNGTTFTGVDASKFHTLTKDATTGIFTLRTADNAIFKFEQKVKHKEAPFMLIEMRDLNNNFLQLYYNIDGEDTTDFQVLAYEPLLLSRVKDRHDRQLNFTYNRQNQIIKVFEGNVLNRSIAFGYSPITINEKGKSTTYSHLTSYTDATGEAYAYRYGNYFDAVYNGDKKFLLRQVADPEGLLITSGYNDRKATSIRTQSQTGTTQTDIDYKPDANTSVVKTKTNGEVTTTTNRFASNGQIDKVSIEPENNTDATLKVDAEVLEWDANFKWLPKKEKVLNLVYEYTYDNRGNRNSTKTYNPNNTALAVVTSATFNSLNLPLTLTDALGNTTTNTFDSKGNMLTSTQPAPLGTFTNTFYSNGSVNTTQGPQGEITYYESLIYGMPRVIRNALGSYNLTYDKAGRNTSSSITLPDGNIVSKTIYDNNDRVIKSIVSGKGIVDPITGLPIDLITTYKRRKNGQIDYIQNAALQKTDLEYEPFTGFLKSVSFGNATRGYTYLPNGAVDTYTKVDGKVLKFLYDRLWRLKEVQLGGVPVYRFYYNAQHLMRKYSTLIAGTWRDVTLTYDDLNRLKTQSDWEKRILTFDYYINGQLKSLTYPSGLVVNYEYYPAGLLKYVKWSTKQIYYEYYTGGYLKKVTYPNNTYEEYTYDFAKNGILTGYSTRHSNGTVINKYQFYYQANGQLARDMVQEPLSGVYAGTNQTNTYDGFNHLQTLNNKAVAYDVNGNISTYGNRAYSFDFDDRLYTVKDNLTLKYLYYYDANGARRQVSRDKVTTYYVTGTGGQVIEEITNGVATDYIWGLGISVSTTNGVEQYYHADLRGSVVAITDVTGAITHKYAYDTYGMCVNAQEPAGKLNRLRFMGKYGVMWEDADLYFVHNRYYIPSQGRFGSEDPIFNPSNLYSYGENNPIENIDPNGKVAVSAAGEACLLPGLVGDLIPVNACINTDGAFSVPINLGIFSVTPSYNFSEPMSITNFGIQGCVGSKKVEKLTAKFVSLEIACLGVDKSGVELSSSIQVINKGASFSLNASWNEVVSFGKTAINSAKSYSSAVYNKTKEYLASGIANSKVMVNENYKAINNSKFAQQMNSFNSSLTDTMIKGGYFNILGIEIWFPGY